MADVITTSRDLLVELSDSTGEYTRTLKIDNPDTETYSTLTLIEAALAPLFPTVSQGGTEIEPFFYDDFRNDIGLTRVKGAQYVIIEKTVRDYGAVED